MDLQTLLRCQAVYFVAGFSFNVLNFLHQKRGGKQFSPTPPKVGGTVMMLYGLSLLLGVYGHKSYYKAAMVLFVIVLGLFAVGSNLRKFGQMKALYLSPLTYAVGTGMNSIGMLLNIAALTH
ncbi:hypothetical protein DIPPA_12533 [Diplonema papillatum]|nr:hypothetical protein DIPPA_12533 [Diplonema papillatum]